MGHSLTESFDADKHDAGQREKVLVAMSGGVDSSLAAALLRERGFDVTGVFMHLGASASAAAAGGCCSPQDADDARRVALHLGIDLFTLDLARQFEPIIEQFVREYEQGRTPNPCLLCNAWLKFGRLAKHADSLGTRYIATGHYARVDGRPGVSRGTARAKDQSYALFGVSREILGRVLLPIGEFADKAAVRAAARQRGLPTHDKPDSQEICFVPDDDYTALLRRRAPASMTPGDVVDAAGRVLGRHDGYARFTIGQRRGVRIAAKEPLYVTDIDPAAARVTLGPRDQLLRRRLRAGRANWHVDVASLGADGEFDAIVQIRYNHAGAPARVRVTGPDAFEVEFVDPIAAITPGQAAVVYDNERLLGGGWIQQAIE